MAEYVEANSYINKEGYRILVEWQVKFKEWKLIDKEVKDKG